MSCQNGIKTPHPQSWDKVGWRPVNNGRDPEEDQMRLGKALCEVKALEPPSPV